LIHLPSGAGRIISTRTSRLKPADLGIKGEIAFHQLKLVAGSSVEVLVIPLGYNASTMAFLIPSLLVLRACGYYCKRPESAELPP
jgi:hypothetical protein